MLNNKKLNSGRSMVEMLGVLGIMAMITALGIIAYTQATKMFKNNQLKSEVANIAIQIKTKIQGSDFGKYAYSNSPNSIAFIKEVKSNFDNFFINTGILNKNITPIGSGTHYGFGNSIYHGVFFIIIYGLTKDECDSLVELFPSKVGNKDTKNTCLMIYNNIYRLAVFYDK